MDSIRSVVLSMARLVLAALVFATVASMSVKAEEEVPGGCAEAAPVWACYRPTNFFVGRYCDPGASGGCENCYRTSNPLDICFYGENTADKEGWMATPYVDP
jgi:hypothetical protein